MGLHSSQSRPNQVFISLAIVVLAAGLAWGALSISGVAGYAGVGPNFLPWVVATVLLMCGLALLCQAWRGGFRQLEAASGAAQGDWLGFAWLSSGVLLNAALINHLGFVLSCTLCFVLAVRGLRLSEGRRGGGLRQTGWDALTGCLIAAPVYWLFGKLLHINLPGLTASGWL